MKNVCIEATPFLEDLPQLLQMHGKTSSRIVGRQNAQRWRACLLPPSTAQAENEGQVIFLGELCPTLKKHRCSPVLLELITLNDFLIYHLHMEQMASSNYISLQTKGGSHAIL